jgi:hypothetical protein
VTDLIHRNDTLSAAERVSGIDTETLFAQRKASLERLVQYEKQLNCNRSCQVAKRNTWDMSHAFSPCPVQISQCLQCGADLV